MVKVSEFTLRLHFVALRVTGRSRVCQVERSEAKRNEVETPSLDSLRLLRLNSGCSTLSQKDKGQFT
jgi:hypothetical protein